MLTYVWPVRIVAALFALALALAVWLDPPRPRDWHYGCVVRGSIRVNDDGYAFTLARGLGSRSTDHFVEVRGSGPLDDTVCDDQSVGIEEAETSSASHHEIEAARAFGFNGGKYDNCWKLGCDRAAYVACRGYDQFQ